MARLLRRFVLVIWIGSLWTIGLLVAPLLFESLDDPSLAGRLAARFFAIETYVSLVAAVAWAWLARAAAETPSGVPVALAIALTLAITHFAIGPLMAIAPWLHLVAAALYVLACLLGGRLVWISARSPAKRFSVSSRGGDRR